MTRKPSPFIFAALLCVSLPLQAAFITDRIEIPLQVEKYGQGAVLKQLVSGARVDVLMRDGKYARVRTRDGTTGWVEARFVSEEKPLGLEYLELRSRHKALQDELAATQKKLSEALKRPPAGENISAEELAALRQGAKDTRWMRAEMNKARERAKQFEAELKALRKQTREKTEAEAAGLAELEALRAQNQDLQDRLAAALLVSETPAVTEVVVETAAADSDGRAWSVGPEWLFGGLLVAFVAGGIGGASWLDRRIRAKHGGFRIY